MTRTIEVRNQLHVIAKSIIRQFLKFGGRHRLRLNQCGRALELEMALQLEREAVDLEKCSLPQRVLQSLHAIEVVRIVPVNLPGLQIGPVLDVTFWQQQRAMRRLDQLHQCDRAIEQAGRRVGHDGHAVAAQINLVSLLGQTLLVAILRRANGH